MALTEPALQPPLSSRGSGRRNGRAPWLEMMLAGLVVATVGLTAWSFHRTGYLPHPYIYDTNDTFMDWFNTAYWANNPGAYSVWRSVYPPLSFVFLRIFSLKSCYASSAFWARDCDGLGQAAILAFYLLSVWLVWRCFRRNHSATALPRAVAMALGLPMLFALERGNLIVPCVAFLALGHGDLVKRAWLRWLAIGVTINFKPYLLVALAPLGVRKRWRRLEGVGLATLGVYLLTFALEGGGSPFELLANSRNWASFTGQQYWSQVYYSTSYAPLLSFLSGDLPILQFVGSRTIEIGQTLMAGGIHLGQFGILMVLGLAWFRPAAVSASRISALSLALLLSSGSPGGYAETFLLFFVFLERDRSAAVVVAVVCAYLLCLSVDHVVAPINEGNTASWLGRREVYSSFGIAAGQFIRPGLLLLMEYALVAASLPALLRRPTELSRQLRGAPGSAGAA